MTRPTGVPAAPAAAPKRAGSWAVTAPSRPVRAAPAPAPRRRAGPLLGALSAVLLVAGPATAQPAVPPATPHGVKVARTLYFAGLAADDLTTAWSLSRLGHEDNPVARTVLGKGGAPRLLVGAAVDVALAVVVDRTLGRRHPKLATVLFGAGSVVRVGFAFTNAVNALNAREEER